ncbi:hypothetical protein DFH29DRAFT_882222 [Suillus ampliporus]|nr:hypothetical protein DFH29DRAFT_882222 [Suillus ampliporus]
MFMRFHGGGREGREPNEAGDDGSDLEEDANVEREDSEDEDVEVDDANEELEDSSSDEEDEEDAVIADDGEELDNDVLAEEQMSDKYTTEKVMSTRHPSKTVTKYFSWVMLSHRWESKEPLLHHIQGKFVYDLDPVGTMVKLQTFCMMQALTIVYLSDVPPSAKSGALANSAWNTRGWTVQNFWLPTSFSSPKKNWSLYLEDGSPDSVVGRLLPFCHSPWQNLAEVQKVPKDA